MSKQIENLAAEVAGMLASDGRPNRWHGYDFEYESGTLRLAAEDPESEVQVICLDEHGVMTQRATFGIENRVSAIAAYVRAAV